MKNVTALKTFSSWPGLRISTSPVGSPEWANCFQEFFTTGASFQMGSLHAFWSIRHSLRGWIFGRCKRWFSCGGWSLDLAFFEIRLSVGRWVPEEASDPLLHAFGAQVIVEGDNGFWYQAFCIVGSGSQIIRSQMLCKALQVRTWSLLNLRCYCIGQNENLS